MKKIILLIRAWFCVMTMGMGQSFVQLSNSTGYNYTAAEVAELEAAADSLVAVFPVEFQADFKVFDFGYYVYNELMTGGSPAVWDKAILEAQGQAPYFLLFGREEDSNGNLNTVRVELRLPNTGFFQCADESYRAVMKHSVSSPLKSLQSSLIGFAESEKNSLNNLKF